MPSLNFITCLVVDLLWLPKVCCSINIFCHWTLLLNIYAKVNSLPLTLPLPWFAVIALLVLLSFINKADLSRIWVRCSQMLRCRVTAKKVSFNWLSQCCMNSREFLNYSSSWLVDMRIPLLRSRCGPCGGYSSEECLCLECWERRAR